MHKLTMTVLGAALFLSQMAAAETKYDKTRAMYEQASAPKSEAAVMALIPKIKGCAQFGTQDPDKSFSTTLKIITHLVNGSGPEFPDQTLKGIGFDNANESTEKFFKSYVVKTDSTGLLIQYDYEHFDSFCGVDGDGWSHCMNYDVHVKDNAYIRISSKYVHFARDPDFVGYCWY